MEISAKDSKELEGASKGQGGGHSETICIGYAFIGLCDLCQNVLRVDVRVWIEQNCARWALKCFAPVIDDDDDAKEDENVVVLAMDSTSIHDEWAAEQGLCSLFLLL
jgi:hypothetical protein